MKKHDLQPTDENIRSTFYNDSIGRNKDLVNFIKIINSIDESYSIALDSYWGSGKTFFVKQVKMILDTITEKSYCKVEGETAVLSKWAKISKKMQLKKHVPIYYDAWANDCDDDPIYSLVYQMILDTENNKGIKDKISFSDVLSVAGKITGAIAGFDPNDIADAFKKGDFLETLRARKDIDKRIEEYIDKLLPEGCDRLLIIIDELDRCNPEFAVKLLERIKHYFNNDKVTFVFSVNLAELQHTIKHHYGADFNASRYLDRFFDLPIKLPPPNMDTFLISQGIYGRDHQFHDSMKSVIKKYNLQLREITRYIAVSKYIVGNNTLHNNNVRNVIIYVLIPIVSALILTDNKQYFEFVNGKNSSPLLEFFEDEKDIRYVEYYLSYLLPGTSRDHMVNSENLYNPEYLRNMLTDFYNALFNKTGTVEIGKCLIDDNERQYFRSIISLLSENTI